MANEYDSFLDAGVISSIGPGIYRGKITAGRLRRNRPDENPYKLFTFTIIPLELIEGALPSGMTEENLPEVQQQFTVFVTQDWQQKRYVKLLSNLGVDTRVTKPATEWTNELIQRQPEVYFLAGQPEARANRPNVDDSGQPIYEILDIAASLDEIQEANRKRQVV